jgi:hypothetical protein
MAAGAVTGARAPPAEMRPASETREPKENQIMTTKNDGKLTKGQRDELGRLARRNEKLAKAAVQERVAELEVNLETQLASIYSFDDDEVWREVKEAGEAAVAVAQAEADGAIAERCEQLGIPDWARPRFAAGVVWTGRGENAAAERRVELRRVGKARIAAFAKKAVAEIERRSVAWQTRLIAGGLESDEARRLLEEMPTAEQLMPAVDVAELRAEVEASPKAGFEDSRRRALDSTWERREELRKLGLPYNALDDNE